MLIIQRPTVEAIGEEEDNRQRFAIGPLEPGFGHTLGNSLRRTLLSSIPGAAVTQVRFDDALHEFTTLPGVKEDVTDIILNLKDLVLRMRGRRARHAAPRRARPGDGHRRRHQRRSPTSRSSTPTCTSPRSTARAASPSTSPSSGAAATCRPTGTRSRSTIGVIPVDSIFSPVRRVAFTVEPTRVEQSTNFDRLVLDIETDGSITPREALASAGDTLRSLVGLVAEMSDAPQGLELGDVAVAGSGSPDLDLPIEDLDLSERPRNCLKRAQVNTIGELVAEDRGRPARHHQLRPEVARRGHPEARRARPVACAAEGRVSRSMPGTPKKGRRFGGDAAHQKAMFGNLVASLIAAEAIVTTEAKAKALRPIAEKIITKAKKGGVHSQRQVVGFIRDKDMAHKLFDEIGPRYADRPGGYTRILKLGPRHGDNAPMARIELV